MSFNSYFDNAATSFPKPPEVAREVTRYLNEIGGPYGRSAYGRAVEVSRVVEATRDLLGEVLGVSQTDSVVFTANATQAINTVLFGMNLRGKRVLVSPLEHNAVMRPLSALARQRGVRVDTLPHGPDGRIDTARVAHALSPDTALVVVNHQSNVNGVVQPAAAIKKALGAVPLLLDASQSAGHGRIALDEWGIDFAAITGHKGLLGPTGTGCLFARDPAALAPLLHGGTGSRSDSVEMPEFVPDKFEAGTPNVAGIFGLKAALENRPARGYSDEDFRALREEIAGLGEFIVVQAADAACQGPVFSLVHKRQSPSDLAARLFDRHGIETRAGLHCAPAAHRTLGTFPQGTLRIALSPYHTSSDLQHILDALSQATDQ